VRRLCELETGSGAGWRFECKESIEEEKELPISSWTMDDGENKITSGPSLLIGRQ
jgi:hypothetical protein